jgi:hypothetical protein
LKHASAPPRSYGQRLEIVAGASEKYISAAAKLLQATRTRRRYIAARVDLPQGDKAVSIYSARCISAELARSHATGIFCFPCQTATQILLRFFAPFLALSSLLQAAYSRKMAHMQAGKCGSQMGTTFLGKGAQQARRRRRR